MEEYRIIGFYLKRLVVQYDRLYENSKILKNIGQELGTNILVLLYICENKDNKICQNDVKDMFSVTKGTVSKLLSNLEKNGYIERKSADDKRKKIIIPTKKTLKIYKNFISEVNRFDDELLKDFNEEEKDQFMLLISKANNNLENLDNEEEQ
ncbi:MAG: MarR family winged helix-turn-helix transcriptional regulator [Bacilli bacterium]